MLRPFWFGQAESVWGVKSRRALPWLLGLAFLLSLAVQRFELLNPYVQLILMYIGINVILTLSLNLVNGYMGEFSVGHAGFMAVGAYVSALATVKLLPAHASPWFFPVAVLCGGLAAALVGLVVAIPSFKTRETTWR
jgi:branched-chain amino acid transport system permease protein